MNRIHQILDQHIQSQKQAYAIVDGDRSYSYGELDCEIEKMVLQIKNINSSTINKVGILLHNSALFFISIFAVSKADYTSVFLNPTWTDFELENYLEGKEIDFIITDKSYINKTSLKEISREIIETFSGLYFIKLNVLSKKIEADIGDAIVANTSGVTGAVKGVVLTHENILKNIQFTQNEFNISKKDKFLPLLPVYHVAAFRFSLTCLLNGGELHLFQLPKFFDLCNEYIELNSITCISTTPYVLDMLLMKGAGVKYPMEKLKYVTTGGAPLAQDVYERCLEQLAAKDLYVLYGLTEATSIVTILKPRDLKEKFPAIGKIIDGMSYKIVNDELLIKGPCVMKGYLDRETDLNSLDEGGWLKTGDLVKIDKDDFITITGRSKDIIIRGGRNISSLEIENVIMELSGVIECAIIGRKCDIGGEEPVLFIVLDQSVISVTEVWKHCKRKLSPHKVPSKINEIKSLPRTSNGKVIKKELK